MMRKNYYFLVAFCCTTFFHTYSQSINLGDLQFRNIGPANQGGRIIDIEADQLRPEKVYIATGSGGVFKSKNAGITWSPIFDDYETASIGDIALDPKNSDIIWVGTGEANNRNSVSWGNGVYKSEDGGKTFVHKGLSATHQIARVLVHPVKTKEICVCAIGHLWGYTGDRGLFVSKDDGVSWQKLNNGLPTDGKTGCTDVVRDPTNPDILYAAFYHRIRQPHTFYSGGEQGGIYKSIDGGKSWKKLNKGLPDPTGRIGLSIFQKNPKIIMAIIEANASKSLDTLGSGIYKSIDGGSTWQYINTYNNRPFYYSQLRIDPMDASKVYVLATTFFKSTDSGKTLTNASKDFEIHGDYHAMWINPFNPSMYYIGADKGLSVTYDGGENFQLLDNLSIAQFYRIHYDMDTPYRIYGGLQDNGSFAVSSFSRDARGILNDHNWKMHWGDGQDALVNPFNKNEAYTSMENGSFMRYNPSTRELQSIIPNAFNITNLQDILNDSKLENLNLRFNWSAPLVMSPHDPSVLYAGGNYLFKTTDKGDTWRIISPDLSTNDPVKSILGNSGGLTPDNSGAEYHCSIYRIGTTIVDPYSIWVCTDDGLVHHTPDGGISWQDVTPTINGARNKWWCSSIVASHFDKYTAYVTIDPHRSDINKPIVLKTTDAGKSWNTIVTGLPSDAVARVIKEDLSTPNLLFLGTETGLFISLDKGAQWQKVKQGLPTVSIYDIEIHPRDHDLILGTHGRGIYILDDISPIRQLATNTNNKAILLPPHRPTIDWLNTSRGGQRGHFLFQGDNPKNIRNTSNTPRAEFEVDVPINFIIQHENIDSVVIHIQKSGSHHTFSKKIGCHQGINRWYWDRSLDADDLSAEDLAIVEEYFNRATKINFEKRVSAAKAQWIGAKTKVAKRNVLTQLNNTLFGSQLPAHLLLPKAGSGHYKLTVSSKDYTVLSSFNIEEDPLKE